MENEEVSLIMATPAKVKLAILRDKVSFCLYD
jgi:hypothetical protein